MRDEVVTSAPGHRPDLRGTVAGVIACAGVAVLVSTTGPMLAVMENGDNGSRGARLLLLAGALLAVGIAVGRPGERRWTAGRAAVVAAAVAVGFVLTEPSIGRAPWAITAALAGAAMVCLGPVRRLGDGREVRLLPFVPLVLAVDLVWWLTTSPISTLVAVVLAAGVTAALVGRPATTVADEVLRGAGAVGVARAQVGVDRSAAFLRGSRHTLAVAAAMSVVSVPMFRHLVADRTNLLYGFNDAWIHLEMAKRFSWVPLHVSVTHPVFHGLTAAGAPLVGVDASATIVLAGALGAMVVVVGWIARTPTADRPGLSGPAAAAVAGFVVLADTPTAALNALGWLHPPRTYFQGHPWSNPTDTVAIPLALLLLVLLGRLVDRDTEDVAAWRPTDARAGLLVLTILVTLAKPAATLALLPAVPLLLLVRRRLSVHRLVELTVWVGTGAVTVLGWQYWFVRTQPVAVEVGYSDYGITLDPFHFVPLFGFGPSGPWFFWLSILPIGLAAGFGRRRFWTDPAVGLAACGFVLSLPGALLLRETGEQADDMNLVKPMLFCVLPLVVFSMVFLAREAKARWDASGGKVTPWLAAIGTLALLWGAGGIAIILDGSGVPGLHATSPLPWPPP